MNLALNQIPSSIDTVEKLLAWSALLLHRNNATLKVLEDVNNSLFACQSSIYQAEDGTTRLVVRFSIELESDYVESGRKLWLSAKEFSEVTIPSAFLAA